MGCGSSKPRTDPDQRRIRINESKNDSSSDGLLRPRDIPGGNILWSKTERSSEIIVAKSHQDARMAENENFARSLPAESKRIINDTLSNMLDLTQTEIETHDDPERLRLYENLRSEISFGKEQVPSLPKTTETPTLPVSPVDATFELDDTERWKRLVKTWYLPFQQYK